MVRFKGRFLFFLLIFGLYLSCPGYSAVKSINIKNLPANQDMDRVERDYGDTPLTLGVTDADGECVKSDCLDLLNETAKCNKCVDLEEKCPGCCLEDDPDAGGRKYAARIKITAIILYAGFLHFMRQIATSKIAKIRVRILIIMIMIVAG